MSFEQETYRDQLYTERQSRILVLLPRFTATLSILGSGTIVAIILRDRSRKLKRVYHRVLLAYSSIDILCSLNYALSSAVVPKGTPGVWGASGNTATCEASGFVTQFSFALGVYATFICVYYVLVLRYRVREKTLARRIEPWVHAFAVITPTVYGIIMLTLGMYNPTNVAVGWCFINVLPMDCIRRDEIECLRGEEYFTWLVTNNTPFFVFSSIVVISSVLTYTKIRSTQRRGQRWSVNRDRLIWQGREAATQALLYIASFVITYVPFGVGTLLGPSPASREHRNFYFPVSVMIKMTLPLQGFWNLFIYIRPRFSAIRRRHPQATSLDILKNILVSSENFVYEEQFAERSGWNLFSAPLSFRMNSRARLGAQQTSSDVRVSAVEVISATVDDENDDFTPEIYQNEDEETSPIPPCPASTPSLEAVSPTKNEDDPASEAESTPSREESSSTSS